MLKLVADKAAKKYEFTYLLPEFYTSAETAKAIAEVEELVKKYQGKIVSSEDWGKKALAYKIRKGSKIHSEALFTHAVIELKPEHAQKFERDVYLSERILRHLLVVEEKASTALEEKTFEKEKAPEKEKTTQE